MHCSWTSHLLAGKIRTDLETCSSEERNRTGTKQHHHTYKPNTKQINKISQDPPQKKKNKTKGSYQSQCLFSTEQHPQLMHKPAGGEVNTVPWGFSPQSTSGSTSELLQSSHMSPG